MKRIIAVFMVVAVAFATLLADGDVFAKKSFTVSPMKQRVVLAPGETYRGGLDISSPVTATEDFDYEIIAAPYFVAKDKNGGADHYEEVDYDTKGSMNAIVDWTTIENPTGTLKPNDRVTISFEINVPKEVPAGGQYMALIVSEDTSKKQPDGDMTVIEKMRMAHIVYAEVAGETRNEGRIIDNNLPSFLTSNVLKASATVANDGNVHADAKYTLQVWPLFSDEEICTNEEDPDSTLVLPGTKKYYSQECNLPMFGIFRAKQVVKIFGEESIVEKTILVCPLWLLFVVIFGIVLLIAWLVARARKRGDSRKTSNE